MAFLFLRRAKMSHVGGGMAFAWWQFFAWLDGFRVDSGICCGSRGEFGLMAECWGGAMV